MIRITDRTLSCLDGFSPSRAQLTTLANLLLSAGADFIEMPAAAYREITPPNPDRLVLRIISPEEAADYPEINRFVCRKRGRLGVPFVTSEIQMNDIREISLLGQYGSLESIRITGLDDVFCYDYISAFENMKKLLKGRIEFCPENNFDCATAAAVEWIMSGGANIVTTFGGIAGKAPFEEVLLALRVVKRHKPAASFAMLPQIAALMEDILSIRYPDRKAVIGKRIFDVESGIHVDGILKKPSLYEPFMPELVGSGRKFVIGKHSGRNSMVIKLSELGLDPGKFDCPALLGLVRAESIKKNAGLTDEEFLALIELHMGGIA